ncbi:MAG: hypothetical protein DCF19_02985 [Pseudanabaena frigida]|uniref:Uncharacterized protein n=1 Tax=Pseudanabaena frigida TaxID=945775 RepID=A0A2W4Y9S0_9CYAN|nr:MAG: hypothetical protein DCF19_02985 [Pseudanabaena frigida]
MVLMPLPLSLFPVPHGFKLNYADYLQEAHRMPLKGGGSLLITETISRWIDKKRIAIFDR